MPSISINNSILDFNAIYYVDAVNGNDDTGNGTESSPYKTLDKALSMVSVSNTAIVLMPGDYTVTLKNNLNSISSREYAAFISDNGKNYSVIGKGYNTKVKVTLNREFSFLASVTQNSTLKLYDLFFEIDIQYNSTNSGMNVIISDGAVSGTPTFKAYNCVFKFIGMDYRRGIVYSNTAHNFSFDNCIIDIGSGQSYTGHKNGSTATIFNNCIFNSLSNWFASYGTSYSPFLTLNNCIESNCGTSYYNVTRNSPIVASVEFNSVYYIINTSVWKDAGTGTDPDGSIANIGVYGGPFAWSFPQIKNQELIPSTIWYTDTGTITLSATITHSDNRQIQYKVLVNNNQVYPAEGYTPLQPTPATITVTFDKAFLNERENLIKLEVQDEYGTKTSWDYTIIKEDIDTITAERRFEFPEEWNQEDSSKVSIELGEGLRLVEGVLNQDYYITTTNLNHIMTLGRSNIINVVVDGSDDIVENVDFEEDMTAPTPLGEGYMSEYDLRLDRFTDINRILVLIK